MPILLFIILFYYLIFPVQLIYAVLGSIAAAIAYSSILVSVIELPLQSVYPTIVAFLMVCILSFYFVRSLNKANRAEARAIGQLQDEVFRRMVVQDKLEQLATTDELTKICNRRHFNELAEQELERARRTGRWVSLLFMDIDHF